MLVVRRALRGSVEEGCEGWVAARAERRAGVCRMWRRSGVDFSRTEGGSQCSSRWGGGMDWVACEGCGDWYGAWWW